MAEPIRVVVTGAAGQIAYFLLYMIARGEVFGKKQPVILHLFDISSLIDTLKGVTMELIDCALPLLHEVIWTLETSVGFNDVSAAFLVGAKLRKEGMDRKDLLAANVEIFKAHGKALDKYARKDVKVLVMANPVNTNALVCLHYAPTIPRENFSALARLDQNRATTQLSGKIAISSKAVRNVVVWGYHSAAQYLDANHGTCVIRGKERPIDEIVHRCYLQGPFIETVHKRGVAIVDARKQPSVMSAAKAACDQMHDWWLGTPKGRYVSMGVYSDGSYGIPKGIIFSFPVQIVEKTWTIVPGLKLNQFAKDKLKMNAKELIDEREYAIAASTTE